MEVLLPPFLSTKYSHTTTTTTIILDRYNLMKTKVQKKIQRLATEYRGLIISNTFGTGARNICSIHSYELSQIKPRLNFNCPRD